MELKNVWSYSYIKSIIDFQKSKKEKVFAEFIDLRKAFDTVWRDGLFLRNSYETLMALSAMYTINTIKIKFANGLSLQFHNFYLHNMWYKTVRQSEPYTIFL